MVDAAGRNRPGRRTIPLGSDEFVRKPSRGTIVTIAARKDFRWAIPRSALVVPSLLLALSVAGCSGSSTPGQSTATDKAKASGGANSSASPDDSASSPAGAKGSAASTADSVSLAGADFTRSGGPGSKPLELRVDVVGLSRRGELLQLVVRVSNKSTDPTTDQRWQISDFSVTRNDMTPGISAFNGVVLTDVKGKKRYLAAADSGGGCVCTPDLGSIFVGAGQSVELTATYAAPPASTDRLDVDIPSVGLLRDVPVS
jgi:hypothetical protein